MDVMLDVCQGFLEKHPQRACGRELSAGTHIFLSVLGLWFHGSTAMQTLLMSHPNISTLCASESWQCEGDKLLRNSSDPEAKRGWNIKWYDYAFNHVDNTPPPFLSRNYTAMLKTFAEVWDLRQPVLMTKMWHPGIASYINGIARAPMPGAMLRGGVQRLVPAYLLLWTPLCMRQYAHGSLMSGVNRSVLNWRDEVRGLMELKQTHLALNRYGASTLVISYADLLWYPESTLQRLGCFLPCLRPFPASSLNFVPRSGVDFNPKSRFKIHGTIRSYGDAHPPRGYGYDLTFGRCTQGWGSAIPELSGAQQQAIVSDLHAYFANHS